MGRIVLNLIVTVFVLVAASDAASLTKNGTKIVGGSTASQGQFISIATLLKQELSGGRTHYCSASLIAPTWVLTSAQCLKGHTVANTRVRTGELDFKVATEYEQMVNVKEFVPHPLYVESRMANDIALIRLASPINYIPGFVGPIDLPESRSEIAVGSECSVAGWGATKEGGPIVDQLQFTYVPAVSDESCRAAYPDNFLESNVCAGYEQGGADSCNGDSGGPLQCGDDKKTLDGLVSFGSGCARPGLYGVYTKVSYYVDWIRRVIEADTEEP